MLDAARCTRAATLFQRAMPRRHYHHQEKAQSSFVSSACFSVNLSSGLAAECVGFIDFESDLLRSILVR